MEQGQAHQVHYYMLQLGPVVSYDNNYDIYIQLLYCFAASGSGFPGAVVGVVVVVVIIALLVVTALTTVIIVLALKLRRYLISYYKINKDRGLQQTLLIRTLDLFKIAT